MQCNQFSTNAAAEQICAYQLHICLYSYIKTQCRLPYVFKTVLRGGIDIESRSMYPPYFVLKVNSVSNTSSVTAEIKTSSA